jgi:hypothetical protein
MTPRKKYWPLDLKVFAIFAASWALFLLTIAIVVEGNYMLADPIQAIVGAAFFNFDSARLVLLAEAAIFGAIGIGILAEQKWSLVFALIYTAQIVFSNLAFAIMYLPERFELTHVRESAMRGEVLVLIALYLWIRTSDLIFDSPGDRTNARDTSDKKDRSPIRARPSTGEIRLIAGTPK